MKSYKKAEISEHNSRKSLWFVIHNRVYDVTKFLTEVNESCIVRLNLISSSTR